MAEHGSIEVRTRKASLLMRIGKWVASKRPAIFPKDASQVVPFLHGRDEPQPAPLPSTFEERFRIEKFVLEGQCCVTLHPRSGPGEKHILYFNGGGFVLPAVREHWLMLGALVDRTGASVTAALYDLVPEHPYANAERLADAAFAHLCTTHAPENIAFAGDSAGGHMALSLALRRIRSGGPNAGKLILFAPWLDVTMRDEAARAVEPHDFMLAVDPLRLLGKTWADDRDPASAECSPLNASPEELAKLPPTRMFVGRHDIFVVDNRTFQGKLQAAGVDARLYEYEAAPHVFMALHFTKEAKDVFGLVDRFLKE